MSSNEKVVFRNNIVIALWIFMASWMSMLLLITYIYIRDGIAGADPHLAAFAIGFFWICGIAGSVWAFSQPRTRVAVAPGMIVVRESYLFSSRLHHYSADAPPPPIDIATDMNDGEPTFSVMLTTPRGLKIPIVWGSERLDMEKEKARLLAFWSRF